MKEGLGFAYLRDRLTKDGVPFRLRPARSADSDQIIANISAVCAEKVYLYTDDFIPTDQWRDALTDSVNGEKGSLLVVAEVDGQLIGHLRLFPVWYGSKSRHVGDVGVVLTRPWRGRGIGAAMLGYSLEWAGQANFKKITAMVLSTNQRALNLFLLYNFAQEGCRSKQLLVEGDYVDEILLGRFLDLN